MCICKPMLDLFSQCHCPVCLVNPLYHPFCWSSLVSVLMKLEHCTPAVWQEEETWMKKTAAALCAVSMEKLLTWQSLLPSQLGFDMLKYRERENGVIEKDSLQMALGIFGMNCQCFYLGSVQLCSLVSLRDSYGLTGLMISIMSETHFQ